MAQAFDAEGMSLVGAPWQVAEDVSTAVTGGIGLSVSVSGSGSLIYLPQIKTARFSRLIWFDRAGKMLARLDDRDPVGTNSIALSPDGRRLAVDSGGVIQSINLAAGS